MQPKDPENDYQEPWRPTTPTQLEKGSDKQVDGEKPNVGQGGQHKLYCHWRENEINSRGLLGFLDRVDNERPKSGLVLIKASNRLEDIMKNEKYVKWSSQ